ncbi:MAG: hypothetical protein ACRDKK_00080 [Gaiellaceae bacterium]
MREHAVRTREEWLTARNELLEEDDRTDDFRAFRKDEYPDAEGR